MSTLTAEIHQENGSYWATVSELPGVFAVGDSLDELVDSLREGVSLVLETDSTEDEFRLEGAVISFGERPVP